MKQYAAHRVYLAGTEKWCNGPQVVSVSEGKVLSLFPFSGEIPSVEWLGGLLIVAPLSARTYGSRILDPFPETYSQE